MSESKKKDDLQNTTKKQSDAVAWIICILVVFLLMIFLGVSMSASTKYKESQNKKSEDKSESSIQSFTGEKTSTTNESIPYETQYVDDANLEYGKTETRTVGKNGTKTITYNLAYENGQIIKREVISEEITVQPTNQVIAKGTKIIWHCVDATSYDRNRNNDNKCTSSTGQVVYVSDARSMQLDSSYCPGQSGNAYYNDRCRN